MHLVWSAALGMRPFWVLLLASGLAAAAHAEDGQEPAPAPPALRHPYHAFVVEARLIPQIAWISGTIGASNGGRSDNVDLQDDIGLDDPESDIGGSLALRLGRHDFVLSAFHFKTDSTETTKREIDFDKITIPINRPIRAKTEVLNVDLQYGYSFFDLETHGFRLGPTISVGYFDFKAAIKDRQAGSRGELEEELPLPTLGLKGELPFRRFLLRTNVAGLYINASGFEGSGVRAGASLAWRLFKHIAVVGGYHYLYADVDDGRDQYKITVQGAYAGVEFRY